MPYRVNIDEGVTPRLDQFAPSFGQSLESAVSNTFNENASTLGYDYFKLQRANQGDKLTNEDANRMVADSGLNIKIPETGYTQDALDILINRQRDQAARQSVMDRTPWQWLGTPVRGAAMLLTGITDPLNVASAFIPVVGEARAASMLARAGEGIAARLGTRAAIGAAEGAVGAAALEPLVYGLHAQLQDDYHMTDSLVNIAFGGLLGGGLHMVGGSVADAMRVGRDPYARFAGLETKQISQVLEYEKSARAGSAPTVEDWTPAMKRAAGFEEPIPATTLEQHVQARAPDETVLSIAPEAPFAKLHEVTPEQARGRAIDELTPELREELRAEATPEAQAAIAQLEGGEVPKQFEERIQARAEQIAGSAAIAKAVNGTDEPPARFLAGMASPETREAALRTAIADMADGRIPDVEALLRMDPRVVGPRAAAREVQSAADRQRSPESAAMGSPEASASAEARLSEAPKEHAVEAAQAELTDAMSKLTALQKNLELGGADPDRLAKFLEGLKAFDEQISDAGKIGKAIMETAMCSLRR